MEINQALIDEIVRRILSVIQPERIILFGSAATGKMTPDSDIDIIVLKAGSPAMREDSVLISDALLGLGYAVDVIVMSKERFEETRNVIGGIAYPVDKYGRVIYEAA
jgi:predicted nucleotidyltransferase